MFFFSYLSNLFQYYFDFEKSGLEEEFKKYAKEAAALISEKGLEADLNPIISKGITEILGVERNNLIVNKENL